jgi:glutathione S-transferase
MSGHDVFERNVRVHMNTLETLMLLLPSMWIAAQHWSPRLCAALGVVYLVGRLVYRLSYLKDPGKRSLGYGLSFMPAAILAVAAVAGIVRQLLRAGGPV